MLVLGVLLLGLACSPEPGPPASAEAIDALPDTVARLRALEHAVYCGTWDLDTLDASCTALRDPAVAAACRRYLGRPHLFRGAALRERGEPDGVERSACEPACAGGPSRLDCVVEGALRDSAGPGCACLEQPLARDECWFRLSEGLRARGGWGAADEATGACLEAGALKGPCLHHQAEFLGGRCAPLDAAGLDGWQDLARSAVALEAAVAHWDAFERQRLHEVIWAGAMRCAFQGPAQFEPQLVEILPDAALPHLRAALAWHLVAAQGSELPPLSEAVAALAQLEASGELAPGDGETVEIPAGPGEGWAHDGAAWCLAQAEGCPHAAVRYFAMGKRLSSDQPEAERVICLLEAAVRQRPGAEAWLAAAADRERDVVRAEAQALQAWLSDAVGVSGTTAGKVVPGP